MSFLFPAILTIGLPLAALPALIHLINLRRRRRIEWGAMQFLLESQKRNKNWILLRQIVLLLLRTAAIALAAVMLAGPMMQSGWAGLFGRGVTHHLVLLDDSYSMTDQWDDASAFVEAKRAVKRLLKQASAKGSSQVVTLLRFSEAKRLAAGESPKFDRRPLSADFLTEFERYLDQLAASETAAGPVEALQASGRLPQPTLDETRIAYLVSDFRRPQWNEATQLKQLAGRLRDRSAKLLLVQCVDKTRQNLALTRLMPQSGVRAAGIETWMELEATNYGDAPATAATVAVEQDGVKLPAVEFDEIPAGKSASRRFRTTFLGAGPHQIQATAESDAVECDNRRYFAATIPESFPVLIVDGSEQGDDGYFLRTALSPGGKNVAGWSPQIEPASFLRRHEELSRFAAICLLDVPRLDDSEVDALQDYVSSGGGLAIFLGSRAQRDFYNQRMYRDGTGLLPAPLGVPTQLLRDADGSQGDLSVSDHSVFRVFAGQRNSFLSVAKVDFYYALDAAWSPPKSGDVKVLARVRNGAPFVLEKSLGTGCVVVELCRLSPKPDRLGAWSNLSVNPAFPVFANELVGYLSAGRRSFADSSTEAPLQLRVAEPDFLSEASVRSPGAAESTTLDAAGSKNGDLTFTAAERPRSGVWEFQLHDSEGKEIVRRLAVNVPVGEGDLHALDRGALSERLKGVDFEFALASQLSKTSDPTAGFRMSDAVLYVLLAALVGEQFLASWASYHPATRRTG